MNTISIYLADDHQILRDSLKMFLSQESDMKVIGEASNGQSAYVDILNLKPDIAIVDITMAQLNGLDVCEKIKQANPDQKLIILSMHKSETHVHKALNIGVNAYVLKDNALDDLVSAIRQVHSGKMFLSPDLLSYVVSGYLKDGAQVSPSGLEGLSVREREILQLLAEGESCKSIAEFLHLSVKTVETHRGNLLRKLSLKGTADLVLFAVRNGLISIE